MVYFKRAEFWHRTPSDDKLTEPLREVAEYLKVKDRTIYRVVAKREIPGFEVGGSWRFRKSEINQLVKDVQSEGPEGDICLFREVNGGALAVEHAHAGDKLVLSLPCPFPWVVLRPDLILDLCLLFIHPPAHGCRKSALRREIPWILRGFQGRLSC